MIRLILFALLVSGCTSFQRQPSSETLPQEVEIVFKGRAGDAFETDYHSNSRTRKFEDGQITNDRIESVDFTTATQVLAAGPETISSRVKTIAKDGTTELHDLAFPELGEEIEFVYRPDGKVLKAGSYPPLSIFFVPSMPIPKGPVAVGDTWTLEHTWMSAHEPIPLKLQVIGILKGIVPCDKSHCADVEISGGVELSLPPQARDVRFESRVWGRVLFSLSRGDVVWSEMRSREEMWASGQRTISESCMLAKARAPGVAAQRFSCDPKEQPVEKIPSL